jgi:streptomycin 6-kinase
MPRDREASEAGPPVELHPPDDATRAELTQDDGEWMVSYLGGQTVTSDLIGNDQLVAELHGDMRHGPIVKYVEARLLAAGRTVVHSDVDLQRAVVADWTLAPR